MAAARGDEMRELELESKERVRRLVCCLCCDFPELCSWTKGLLSPFWKAENKLINAPQNRDTTRTLAHKL